jgi:hypothetical protein
MVLKETKQMLGQQYFFIALPFNKESINAIYLYYTCHLFLCLTFANTIFGEPKFHFLSFLYANIKAIVLYLTCKKTFSIFFEQFFLTLSLCLSLSVSLSLPLSLILFKILFRNKVNT